jgi:hypothetical protein
MSEMAVKSKKCMHHWIIEPPDGPTSKGYCKYCGAVAEFFNDYRRDVKNMESSIEGVDKARGTVVDEDDSPMIDISLPRSK